ncbi:hypothetical protein PCASD_10676 [Puccinia coronata f. sp. avenae]|uniref:Secreted protein n=1 Tax=Puccinia coronata f. sp. avenae TaxID=200324 RepID=A0A2N5UI83_9BASI|nr:hypothetical protein PCASD_10676 [Puccinia coronata f. sp. avenae]
MHVLRVLLAYSSVGAVALLAGQESATEDGFRCTTPVPRVNGREASVPFCGHPKRARGGIVISFTHFAPATPVGRSPVDHYVCINGPKPLYLYCCIAGTIKQGAVSEPSVQQVNRDCHLMTK